jgi:hypothetical protein
VPVQIELDKPRTLMFDLAAVRDLEAAMGGKTLGNILSDVLSLGVNAITVALWAGLKHEDKSLNVNLVTKILAAYLKAGIGEKRTKTRLRLIGDALDDALHETGLFEKADAEGNAQPEPVAT